MSTLNISVIAFVAVVVALVMLFNFWQSRVNRREAERLFRRQNGIIEERAGIARRRQESFERGMEPEHRMDGPGADAFYADDLFDSGDDGRDAGAPGFAAARSNSGARSSKPVANPEADQAMDPAAARTARGSSVLAEEGAVASASRDDAPAANAGPAVLDRFAEDLRRITDRMPRVGPETATTPQPFPARAATLPNAPGRDARSDPATARTNPDLREPDRKRSEAIESDRSEPGENDDGFRFVETPGGMTIGVNNTATTVSTTRPGPVAAGVLAGRSSASAPSHANSPPIQTAGNSADDSANGSDELSAVPSAGSAPLAVELPTLNGPPGQALRDVFLQTMLLPPSPVNADRLIALMSSLRHAGSKPVRIEIDGGDGRFVPLVAGGLATRIRCAALLANRQGPLNAVELSDFTAALSGFADQLGARFEQPDMSEVLEKARRLDSLAADLDTQVELTVEAPGPVSASQLVTIGKSLGLFERGGGRFTCLSEDGHTLYSMSAAPGADQILFVLDVARVDRADEPWQAMVRCASDCSRLVGGRLVDSQARGLSVGMIEAVGRQLEERFAQLEAAGLRAGSDVALLVFN